jgi:hypothetical protein
VNEKRKKKAIPQILLFVSSSRSVPNSIDRSIDTEPYFCAGGVWLSSLEEGILVVFSIYFLPCLLAGDELSNTCGFLSPPPLRTGKKIRRDEGNTFTKKLPNSISPGFVPLSLSEQ